MKGFIALLILFGVVIAACWPHMFPDGIGNILKRKNNNPKIYRIKQKTFKNEFDKQLLIYAALTSLADNHALRYGFIHTDQQHPEWYYNYLLFIEKLPANWVHINKIYPDKLQFIKEVSVIYEMGYNANENLKRIAEVKIKKIVPRYAAWENKINNEIVYKKRKLK